MNKIVDAAKWVFSSSETAHFRRLLVRSMFSPGLDLVLVALVLAAVLAAAPANATDAGSCYAIGDSDQRNFCLAKARGESGQCYAIQNAGLRAQCLAEVRR